MYPPCLDAQPFKLEGDILWHGGCFLKDSKPRALTTERKIAAFTGLSASIKTGPPANPAIRRAPGPSPPSAPRQRPGPKRGGLMENQGTANDAVTGRWDQN